MPGVFGSYFETIKPFIYMRSRSLTAGSADQHAYTQNLLEVCAVMCVRHISSCIVDRRWYSIIIARRRDSASASREKGKKVSAINAHAYCVHARLDANQECVCTRIYTCLYTHSILIPQVKEKAPRLIHVANDNSMDDATTSSLQRCISGCCCGADCRSFNCRDI